MGKDVESLAEALRLQHTRCEVYHLWDAKFHTALSGVLSPTDLAATLSQSIVTAFQKVSSSLRQLQEKTRTEDGVVFQFLDAWVDKVQRLEQEHYRISVLVQQVLARHCAVVPCETNTRPADVDITGGEKVESAARDCVCASLHDSEGCAARRLVPVSFQTTLTWVSCLDAMFSSPDDEDDLKWHEKSDSHPQGELTNNSNNNNNSNNSTEHNNSNVCDGRVSFALKSGVEVMYVPREVQQRCVAFNKEIIPLYQMKRKLQQELQELTEELQDELAGATAVG